MLHQQTNLRFSYLQKLSNVVVATWVTLRSWYESSSSSRIIFTTTTWTELPMVGSLYNDDTMFMIVSRYVSTFPSSWNCIIDGSATTSASTCRGVITDLATRLLPLLLLWCLFSRSFSRWFLILRPPWTITYNKALWKFVFLFTN